MSDIDVTVIPPEVVSVQVMPATEVVSVVVYAGVPGDDGASAYEVAVAEGFVGTESDWLTSLTGSPGAQGSSGVVAASSPLAYDAPTKTVSLALPIPPNRGGSGISNFATIITTTGRIDNLSLAGKNGTLIFTGNTYVQISGLNAAVDGTEYLISNFLSSSFLTIELLDSSSFSSAVNRFKGPGASVFIPWGSTYRVRYTSAFSRWIIVQQAIVDASTSLAGQVSLTNQSWAGVKSFLNGIALLNYTRGCIPHVGVSGIGEITQDINLFFDRDTKRFGVQNSSPQGVGHFKSAIGQAIADTSGLTATLVEWADPVAPSSLDATPSTPDMQTISSVAASINYGLSGYTADNNAYDFIIRAGYDNGDGTITWGVTESAPASATDDGSSNPFGFDFSFPIAASNYTPNVYSVRRQINGGGYAEFKRFYSNTFYDDGTGWTSGADDFSNQFDDYASTGRTFSLVASAYTDTPTGTRICSAGTISMSYSDPNDGSAFKLGINLSGQVGTGTVELDGSYHYDSGNFTASPSIWVSGANATTPNTYGLSGDSLNRSYDFYGSLVINGTQVFSPTAFHASTLDPSTGLKYYVRLDGFSPANGKIIRDGGVAHLVSSSAAIYDDGVGAWSASLSVEPQTYYPPSVFHETAGTTPIVIRKSTILENGEILIDQWLGADDVELASIIVTRAGMIINAPSVSIPNLAGGGGGGGGGGGDISNGGNSTGSDVSIGTLDNHNLDFKVNNALRMRISAAGGIGIGSTSPTTETLLVYRAHNGVGSWTGISSDLLITGAGSSPNGFQQGAYVNVRADHDTGILDLLRNYFTSEMSGDGVITETYGARAISRIFDYNAGAGDTSSGLIITGYGLEAYVGNVATGGARIRNAIGIYISRAHATGSDSGHDHVAIGLRIDNIVASGGDTNNTFAIKSTTPAKSWFEGDVWLRDGMSSRFYNTDNSFYAGFKASDTATESQVYTLPEADGTPGQNLSTNGNGEFFWSAPGGTGNINNGGNTFGSAIVLGTSDGFDLVFKTNDTYRVYLKSSGAFLVGDDGSNVEAKSFGARYYESADNNKPAFEFQGYFGYYGNSSTSRTNTSYNYTIRPGDGAHTYSGEHIGLSSEATLGTDGTASSLNGMNNRVSNISNAGILSNAVAGLYRVINSGSGVIRKATAIEVSRVDATGSDANGHEAAGLKIAYDGNLVTASGSATSNKAFGILIGDGLVASGTGAEAWAIKSESAAPSKFAGQMQGEQGFQVLTTVSKPSAAANLRGTIWSERGGAGVADTVEICVKLADDSYAWVSLI